MLERKTWNEFRGAGLLWFSDKDQAEGYLAISQWVADNASTLLEESK
jgi:hypothetical protein